MWKTSFRSALLLFCLSLPALFGCGDEAGQPFPPACGSCPDPASIDESLFPSMDDLWEGIGAMEQMGPRLTGSPVHNAFIDRLAGEMERLGCVDIRKEPIEIERWVPVSWALERTGPEGVPGVPIPTAGYYPYSGVTGPEGVSGPLVHRRAGSLEDVEGKIVFMEAVLPPLKAGSFFRLAEYVHEPDPDALEELYEEDYTRAWLSLAAVVPDLEALKQRGAKGVVLGLDMVPEEATGQYLPFTTPYQDLPAVLVDRPTSGLLKQALELSGSIPVRLIMNAALERVTTWHLTGFLPGQSDSVIVLCSHTDGQNAVEENGPLGILSIVEYFARMPAACRKKTLCLSFVTGHFHTDVHDAEDWIVRNPEIIERMDAAVFVEHLGTTLWLEDDRHRYASMGRCEPGSMFVSRHDPLLDTAVAAVQSQDLRRTAVIQGVSFGVGIGFMLHRLPMIGYLTGPTYLLNLLNGGLDKLDRGRMAREVRTFTEIVGRLDAMPPGMTRE